MKIVRFAKKLWSDVCSEKDELKDFAKSIWFNVKIWATVFGVFWLLGKGVEAVGLSKYVPKTPNGEEAGALVYGVIAFMILLLTFAIFSLLFVAYVKIKKTWDEV